MHGSSSAPKEDRAVASFFSRTTQQFSSWVEPAASTAAHFGSRVEMPMFVGDAFLCSGEAGTFGAEQNLIAHDLADGH
jgi:hypothetical protein